MNLVEKVTTASRANRSSYVNSVYQMEMTGARHND